MHPFGRLDPKSILSDSAQRMVDNHLAAVKLGTPDDFFIFGIYIAADAKLCCGPGKHHHKGPSGQTLGLQQRGNQNIGVEDDPNHCSEGRRSRRSEERRVGKECRTGWWRSAQIKREMIVGSVVK